MRALVKLRAEPGLWVADVPKPTIGPDDVLIRITKTGICGTDLHIFNWDLRSHGPMKLPMTIGHEFVGVVSEVGADVTGLPIGARVSGEGHLTCGKCRNCRAGHKHLCRNTVGLGVNRSGCFAEYLALPAQNVVLVPPSIPDEVAAFLDPLGNAVHTALSFDLVGEDVLITGAGPIGVMAAAVARHVGARHVVVTDVNDFRLGLAKAMGATRTVNVVRESLDDVKSQLGMTEGFDVGLEMSGQPTATHSMLRSLNYGGRVAMLGIPTAEFAIDWNQVIFKGLTLKGIYGRQVYETWYKMFAMLESGLDVLPVITHRLPAAQFAEGFALMRTGMAGKVVLDWS